jgi:outer membrane protein OmpU
MKNVLFATTALVLTAGVASAEVTFSGSAGAGVYQAPNLVDADGNPTPVNDLTVWSGIDLNVAASATTDGGVTVSVSEDMGAGSLADYDDDYAVESQNPDLQTPTITIAAGAVTVSLEDDAIDHLDSDAVQGDVGVSVAMGDATIAVVMDVNGDSGTDFSWSLGYTMGQIALSASGQDDSSNFGATYTMGDVVVGVSTDDNGAGTTTNEVTVDYTAGAMTLGLAADDQDSWSVSVGYSAGPMSVNFSTDEDSAWEANASYDLGGGVSMNAALNEAEYMAAGINFSF